MSDTATAVEEKTSAERVAASNVINMQGRFSEVAALNPDDAAYVRGASEREAAPVRAYGRIREEQTPGTAEFAARCKELDHRSLGYRLVKRIFDIAFSALVIVVGFIPGLVLALVVAVDTKSSPIYSQTRVGKYGRPFKIYKFRTMVADSDNVEKYFTPEQLKIWKRERKVEDDPRITSLGRKLRATSFDEFPQFINVLFGQISIIGPRVITYDELDHFGKDKALLLSVSPAITGAWQCGPRNVATFDNGLRQKIELSYASNASLEEDARIFFKTISVMLIKRTGK
ncbi:MAG: sugar transferase [Eggerthellaceae bacterium]|jgi:lipopolysaccharide/colanic/teichoic acid biosynthesis glycosyltransferase